MKKMSLFVSALAVGMLVLLSGNSALKVEAAEANNYAVKYCLDSEGKGEWRYQEGSDYKEDAENRELYYLLQSLKDGDKVAVYNDISGADELNLGNIKLQDLTLCGTAMTVVRTGGISNCNVLAGSTCSITGNVDTAQVYDVSTVTFVDNVTELIALADKEDFDSNIGCGGTVWHLHAYSLNAPRTFYDKYNFAKNTLSIANGTLLTDSSDYDDNAPAGGAPQPAVPTAAPDTPATSVGTTTPSTSGEYDDVPKTGENDMVLWLLAASALCFAGGMALKKQTR